MEKICVFCGSSFGSDEAYSEAARALGKTLLNHNLGLVYGGGHVGLMGEIARTVLEGGGHVTGVIPQALADRELAYKEVNDMRVVNSMHERKALMAELSDGFIAMPGGLGTMEEFFEVITWSQLAFHNKPCGLLNVKGFYDQLIRFIDGMVEKEFVDASNREMILIDDNPEALIFKMKNNAPSQVDKVEKALKAKRDRGFHST